MELVAIQWSIILSRIEIYIYILFGLVAVLGDLRTEIKVTSRYEEKYFKIFLYEKNVL